MTKPNRPYGGGQEERPLPPESAYPEGAWTTLEPYMTPARRQRMEQVAAVRTRRIRLVIQDVHQPHNVSACMRSAEAFGIQDVDVVTLSHRFKPTTVAKGVVPWLTVRRHRTVESCVTDLRRAGYKIAAGLPRPGAVPLPELPLNEPIAVVFGNEHAGVDTAWLDQVDLAFTIPMLGMVESLNISVSAAVTLFQLSQAMRAAMPKDQYFLQDAERRRLLDAWACRHTAGWEAIIARLHSQAP